ncbi:TadE/TadG family type IV pilus assembly protein [Sphingomonas sp.]|uniref:TadE/TadG family type IV pilus assembly protein n=1 Tax=Sphingomonas sp. TaxID=28214 RepID=UPI000DAF7F5E|nr:TadE/TadG family type IV pilus assembly protein [Sphingomonas sp.]PZU09205.1 MAG: pilus assembly protein TadE [Sphingomonas sp.]
MIRRSALRRLAGDRKGLAAVEFGLVSVPVILMLLTLVDLGFRSYIASQLQGTMDQAARKVTIGGVSTSTVSSFVTDRIKRILPGATVLVVPKSYDDFSDVGKPEPITTDTAPLGSYNTGDCFLDLNGNGVWDNDGGTAGNGTGDDIVYYVATVTYPTLMPLGRFLGWGSTETVTATMMMRNQPYAAQPQPATVCT